MIFLFAFLNEWIYVFIRILLIKWKFIFIIPNQIVLTNNLNEFMILIKSNEILIFNYLFIFTLQIRETMVLINPFLAVNHLNYF